MAAPRRTKIGDVTLDATLSIRFSERVVVTRHPMEEGAEPPDHAREEPEDLTIEGVLSGYALPQKDRDARGEQKPSTNGYAETQYKTLRDYKAKRNTLTVVTAQRTLKNMILTGLDRQVTAALGGAVRFTATLTEVRFVKTENVRLSQTKKPTKVADKANGKVDQSKQPTTKGNDSYKSTAKTWTDQGGWTTSGGGVAL